MADIDQAPARTPTTDTPTRDPSLRQRLLQHLAQPFFRNAYSLVLNTGVTGALGLAFWLLAARTYGDADVGRGSVTIALFTLLSGLVALNITGTMTRFVSASGARAGQFVAKAYVLTVIAVTLLAVAFLLTRELWGPSYAHLADPRLGVLFAVAVVIVAVSTLQDSILMGLRRASWVPAVNAVFGVAKIAALLALAESHPRDGVYLAWVIPMAIIVVPVGLLIFGRLIPAHRRSVPAGHLPPARGQISRFFAADYVGALCLFATTQVVPVMVATDIALHSFGYFYIAWTVGSMLAYVAVNMATSLTVEAAYDMTSVAANCRAAISRTLGLLLIAAVTVALVAPYGLGLLGRGYLDAASLLQLLAVAALPTALTEIYLGVLRARNATREISLVQAARGVLVLAAVFLSLRLDAIYERLGMIELTGIGLAVLASQSAVAVWVLPRLRRVMAADRSVPVLNAVPLQLDPGSTPVDIQDHTTAGMSSASRTVVRPDPGVDDAHAPGRRTRQLLPAGLGLLSLAAVVLFLVPLRSVDLRQLDGLGLVSVLPLTSMVAVALLAVAFLGALALPRPYRLLLGGQIVLLVLCLHALPVVLESMPRFPTAWVHVGFIEFINRTGMPAPGIDGRFSWPGFFALAAFLTGGREWQDLAWVIRLTPAVSNLLYLAPLALLLSNMCASWRAKWLAAGLFVVLNWVGQDYLSPQGFTFLLYLVFLAVLVTWFRPVGSAGQSRFRLLRPVIAWLGGPFRGRRPGDLPRPPVGRREQAVLLTFLVALFAVIVASHQLTPFLAISACLGLVAVGRCSLRGLPTLMVVISVGWISFMAYGYWSGHLDEVLGGVGQITSNVSSSVAGRAYESGPQHLQVLHARMGLALVVGLLAVVGAWRRWRRGFDDRIALVLLVAPGVALAMQSYGGEIALRVYMFALPAACLLAAYAVFPDFPVARLAPRHVVRLAAAILCIPLFIGGFLLTRYGNEAFEYVRAGEVAALDHVYESTSGPVEIMWLSSQPANVPNASMVHGYRDMERVSYVAAQAPRDATGVSALVDRLRESGPGTYVLTTRSQEAELIEAEGYSRGWGDRFRAAMAGAQAVEVVVANDDAVVYAARTPNTAAEARELPSVSASTGHTPLTVAGVVCMVALLGLLLTRELRRLRTMRGEPQDLQTLTWASVPLAVVFLVVVIERFVVLT